LAISLHWSPTSIILSWGLLKAPWGCWRHTSHDVNNITYSNTPPYPGPPGGIPAGGNPPGGAIIRKKI